MSSTTMLFIEEQYGSYDPVRKVILVGRFHDFLKAIDVTNDGDKFVAQIHQQDILEENTE
jgi:hypothetical protein